MKKSILFFTALAMVLFGACASKTSSKNDGRTVSKTFKTAPFSIVSTFGSMDVHYVQDSVRSVKIVAGEETMKRLRVITKDSMLVIKMKDNNWRFFVGSTGDIDVYVSSPDLTGVYIAGSGDFDAKGHVDTDEMSIKVAGSGDVSFKSLICNSITAEVAGSGDVDFDNLITGSAEFSIAGSGSVSCEKANIGTLRSSIAGSGSIDVSGEIKEHTEDIAGSGSVNIK